MTDMNQAVIVWRKSTKSGGGDCVEIAFSNGSVLLRDSKDPSGPVLSFTPSEWAAFLAGVCSREFDQR
jgi:Domain of unknown function (DUF397)